MYEWDEAKRKANLRKHGFDFDDADTVLENPNRITFAESGRVEKRWRDLAFVGAVGSVLAVFSNRRMSLKEAKGRRSRVFVLSGFER